MADTSSKSTVLIKRIWQNYMRPYKVVISIAVFFMLIYAAMTVGFAKLLQPAMDEVLIAVKDDPTQVGEIWIYVLAIFSTFFIRGIAAYIHSVLMSKMSQSVISDIQVDLFKHFMILDLGFFKKHSSGGLVAGIISDVAVMRSAVTDAILGLGKNLFTLIGLLGLMIYQDWRLSIIVFIVFPLAAFVVLKLGRRIRKVSKSLQNQIGDLSSLLVGSFQGIRQIQAYGTETRETERTEKIIHNVRDLNIKTARIGHLSTPINEVLVGMVVSGILAYGAYQIAQGELTPGELVSFIGAFSLAYEPMKKLARLNNSIQQGLGAAERVFKLQDQQPDIKDAENAEDFVCDKANVVFRDISFSYEDDDKELVTNFSLELKPETVTAFVGPSGSGKTTLMNMIPRFYDPNLGGVSINGQDLRNMTLQSLRQNIALVSQDVFIFDDTVANNISYGDDHFTSEDVVKAAKDAAIHDFIVSLPEGYETRLGELGTRLSGGQKQRISIARALLRKTPILLLDEATSALDNESEKLIHEAFKKLQKGRTTLIIAHRLSTIKDADRIVYIDTGKIKQVGTHDELMAQDGPYRVLYTEGSSA